MHYYNLIDKKDSNDPLSKIIHFSTEENAWDGFIDSMGEKEDYRVPGLQHRYPETALLIVNERCFCCCRYCFRKRFFTHNKESSEVVRDIDDVINYIKNHKEITNVLLSGGDPFIESTETLTQLLADINKIDHIQYVRIGTKSLAFSPQRILDDSVLLKDFSKLSKIKPIYVIAHFDHPNEISEETNQAVSKLLENGIQVLSHAVLLKGINDNEAVLKELFLKMIRSKIIPYYIFQAIPILRATHFQVPLEEGLDIFNAANRNLSGMNKKARFIIPHYIGKVELLGKDEKHYYLKHQQARDKTKSGLLFKVKKQAGRVWFDSDEIQYL